jgi:hypothetical protein
MMNPSSARIEQTRHSPGKSPFHVKGHVYRSSIDYYSRVVSGGAALVFGHLDDAHRAFFDQPFLAGSWYDALPLLPLSHVGAGARGMRHYDAMRERATAQAKQDVEGIYRAILRITSPELVALRVGRVLLQYFDFGHAYAQIVRPGTCEIVQSGVPVSLVELGTPLADGFIVTLVTMAGGRDVHFSAASPMPDGRVEGMATMRVRYDVAWS